MTGDLVLHGLSAFIVDFEKERGEKILKTVEIFLGGKE